MKAGQLIIMPANIFPRRSTPSWAVLKMMLTMIALDSLVNRFTAIFYRLETYLCSDLHHLAVLTISSPSLV